jgi:hypothetical protein
MNLAMLPTFNLNLATLHRLNWFAVAAAAGNISSFWILPFINFDYKKYY